MITLIPQESSNKTNILAWENAMKMLSLIILIKSSFIHKPSYTSFRLDDFPVYVIVLLWSWNWKFLFWLYRMFIFAVCLNLLRIYFLMCFQNILMRLWMNLFLYDIPNILINILNILNTCNLVQKVCHNKTLGLELNILPLFDNDKQMN